MADSDEEDTHIAFHGYLRARHATGGGTLQTKTPPMPRLRELAAEEQPRYSEIPCRRFFVFQLNSGQESCLKNLSSRVVFQGAWKTKLCLPVTFQTSRLSSRVVFQGPFDRYKRMLSRTSCFHMWFHSHNDLGAGFGCGGQGCERDVAMRG